MKAKMCLLYLLILLNISCSKDSKLIDSNLLLGIWESEKYEIMGGKSVYVFSRSEKLNVEISIIFEEKNIFKLWEYGWCGTPPLTYSVTVGSYQVDDNELKIEVNGNSNINGELEIVELTSDTLKLMKL